MGDVFVAAVAAIGVLTSLCCCICLTGAVSHAGQFEVIYSRNPAPRVVVQSTGSDEPEDPVDFNSKPKSSATSLGS
jgi:hypothetical protein